jgi:hypothetical protein
MATISLPVSRVGGTTATPRRFPVRRHAQSAGTELHAEFFVTGG